MWQIYLFLCVAIIAVYRIDGANESVKPEVPLAAAPTISAAPKVMRIYIDTLANDYLAMEKMLWSKIETQQLLVERGILLDEIYREHKRILEANFGQHATIWSLGLQRHAKLFNEILAINTNARNIKEYIFAKENDKVLELAQNAHEQMENSAAEFYKLISDKSFWENIVYNVANEQCTKKQAMVMPNANQLIFDIHNEASALLLKNYINVQLSSMILKVTDAEKSKQKPDENRQLFRDHYDAMQTNTHELLKKASRRKWACDKNNYPATYYQITRFIQGYVDNEVNINPDASCTNTCADYTRTRNYDCRSGTLCGEQHIDRVSTRCNGTILDCEFIDDDLSACPATQKLDTRRYEFIRYADGTTFGKFDSCLQSTQVASWTSWFVKCSNCFCYCDEPGHLSDRYFSLHDVTSNIAENRIVTGVSITKRNRMIQFIVAESTLKPYGQIDTTIKSADGETSGITNDRYVSHDEFEINGAGIKDGIDFHTLTYENRKVNLDAVTAPPGKLVTGIRFHVTNDGRLTIQIRATDFNYVTGKLENLEQSIWLSSSEKQRSKLQILRPDVPTRTPIRSEANWVENQFIEFGPSDRVKDAGQVTVPFIDGSAVEAKPTILSGAGLFYKEHTGYGGFISPFLIVYDYASLIKPLEK